MKNKLSFAEGQKSKVKSQRSTFLLRFLSSVIYHLSSVIRRLSTVNRQLSTGVRRSLSSVISHLSSFFRRSLSTVNCQLSTGVRRSLSTVNRHLSTVIRCLSSVNCQLSTFFRLSLTSVIFLLTGCNSPYTPKPTGYFKVDFPEKKYQVFNQPGYPYTFEYPVYANVAKDSTFFGAKAENPWWININFPQFNSHIYVSYKVIGQYTLDKLLNDAFNMTNKHSEKADFITDTLIETPNGVHGMFFSVEGNVATGTQFFLTDSTKNFLRGALYFDATPNQDSLKPVSAFLVADMKHLINTFKWK